VKMSATSLSTSGVTVYGGLMMLSFDSIMFMRFVRHPENCNLRLLNFHRSQPGLPSIFHVKWKTKCFVTHPRAINWLIGTRALLSFLWPKNWQVLGYRIGVYSSSQSNSATSIQVLSALRCIQ
jgi:hypothetical protein